MPSPKSDEGLKRVVGAPALAMAIVNGTIGAGIFALPGIIGKNLGGFAIFGYLFCALMLGSIMMCYAEIGSKYSKSGGSYAYVKTAFGPFLGFIISWLYFFGWGILGSAALMNVIADSLANLFPIFAEPWIRATLYFLLIGSIVMVNIVGVKQGMRVVQLFTIVKLLPLFAIIVFGFSQIKMANLKWDEIPTIKTFADTSLVLFFAFAGFETSLGVSGEFKDPKKTVPRGLILGGVVILIIYLLLQIVVQGVLGSKIADYQDAPLAAVAGQIVGAAGTTILLIAAAISCLGTVSGDVMASPRCLFAGANDGLFPKFLGKVHPKFSTPWLAIIAYGSLIFIFSVSGGFSKLALLASASILLVYLTVILATVKLRMRNTDSSEKTFKVPGGLIIPIIGVAAIIWLFTSLKPSEFLYTGIFIGIIGLIYFLLRRVRRQPDCRK